MSLNVLLLSIHEKYADKIFDGCKTVELRRLKPRLNMGDLVVVYVTSPRKEIVGILEVAKVVALPPDLLWKAIKSKSGLTSSEFYAYFENSPLGFAIFVRKYDYFSKPLALKVLREKWSGFSPPQGYRYLDSDEIRLLESMAHYDISGFSDGNGIVQGELCLATV